MLWTEGLADQTADGVVAVSEMEEEVRPGNYDGV